MSSRVILAADLFCGAGETSTGLALQPHELARAMSFDDGYTFAGNREDQVRQIGNAVPVQLAQALCRALLEDRRPITDVSEPEPEAVFA